MPSSSSSSTTTPTTTKPRKITASTNTSSNHHHSPLFCRHHSTTTSASFSATLDLLILILVVISGTFLISSYFSYLFTSLSLLLPTIPLPPPAYLAGVVFALSIFALVFLFRIVYGLFRPRRCGNPYCKGLKKALEFDLQLQTEETLKSVGLSGGVGFSGKGTAVDVERLPWKGGSESNPDYECLRAELRKMAPINGRAVLLFRAKCGCPVAKLVGWGAKKGRKHKKALASTAINGDHR